MSRSRVPRTQSEWDVKVRARMLAIAERVRLTRAIRALALRARCARPKSLQAILSNSGEFVHAPCSAQSKWEPRTGSILIAQVAERVRFELTSPVKGLRFSRPVHSTALPPLHPAALALAARFYPTINVVSGP
jgi:hypothetical protein